MTAGAAGLGGIELERNPDLGWVGFTRWKLEALRHNAHDGAASAVELRIAVHDGFAGAKGTLPEPVREHGCQRRTRGVVGSGHDAAEGGSEPERPKHPSSQVASRNANRLAFARQVGAGDNPTVE